MYRDRRNAAELVARNVGLQFWLISAISALISALSVLISALSVLISAISELTFALG